MQNTFYTESSCKLLMSRVNPFTAYKDYNPLNSFYYQVKSLFWGWFACLHIKNGDFWPKIKQIWVIFMHLKKCVDDANFNGSFCDNSLALIAWASDTILKIIWFYQIWWAKYEIRKCLSSWRFNTYATGTEYIQFQTKLNATAIHEMVCDRCSVNKKKKKFRWQFFINTCRHMFCHLKLEFASAIPALGEWKLYTNKSAA